MFIDRLISKIKEKNNPSIVGLDSKLDYVPDYIVKRSFAEYGCNLDGAANALFEYNKVIIDAIADYVPMVKPQLAYYEMYGVEGIRAFTLTADYARERGLLVLADAKRGDIGSTAECYAAAFLGEVKVGNKSFNALSADALTVNPYLGYDGIKPFEEMCKKNNKGIFILVKTSNPSSVDFQDLETKDCRRVYEIVAQNVSKIAEAYIGENNYSSIGAVVGATFPEEAKAIRRLLPRSYILVPGYGAQGGKASNIAGFFNGDGLGAVISSSREILLAYKKEYSSEFVTQEEFFTATRNAVIKMRDDINGVLHN